MMLTNLIRKRMEVHMDDMFIKSLKVDDHVTHINEAFQILWRYRMTFKCAFDVTFDKILIPSQAKRDRGKP